MPDDIQIHKYRTPTFSNLGSEFSLGIMNLTSEEADAAQGLISTTSPIGKALLGRRVGDEIKVQTPAGIKEFEVIRLKTIHEDV